MNSSSPMGFPGGFTVLMSVFRSDSPSLFRMALASVYANSLAPSAFQLVVDGPVPSDIEDVIEAFATNPGFRVLRLAENVGLAKALNAGLAEVTTAWVVRADADDCNLPGRFAAQARAVAADPQLALIGGAILEVDLNANPIARRVVPMTHEEIVTCARWRSPFNHMSVAYRLEPVLRVGGYPNIHLKEDYGLWASLIASGTRAANLPDVLVHATAGRDMYRRRGGWAYARAEIQLQRHLVRCDIKPLASALVHGVVRSAVFLLPSTWRGLLYERLLRKDVA